MQKSYFQQNASLSEKYEVSSTLFAFFYSSEISPSSTNKREKKRLPVSIWDALLPRSLFWFASACLSSTNSPSAFAHVQWSANKRPRVCPYCDSPKTDTIGVVLVPMMWMGLLWLFLLFFFFCGRTKAGWLSGNSECLTGIFWWKLSIPYALNEFPRVRLTCSTSATASSSWIHIGTWRRNSAQHWP